MSEEIKTYEYESEYGGSYSLQPWINMYNDNNNLYLGFRCYDEEFECWDPFCDATVNVGDLPYLYSAIDTNNNGTRFLDFLEANGFGQRTPFPMYSGMCVYPVFLFNAEKLKEIDPVEFAKYQKANGIEEKKTLSDKIADAEAKTSKPGTEKQGRGEPQR